jgi:hypothetical protein
LKSWEAWFWQERFFLFPYEFAGVLLALGLLVGARRLLGRRALPVGWAAIVIVLVAAQLEWAPILNLYDATRVTWGQSQTAASQLMSVYDQPAYRGRVLNIPPDKPAMFYAMVEYHGLRGRNVVGQLYDPFYYFPKEQKTEVADTLIQCWLTSSRTRLWAVDPNKQQYLQVIANHPEWFTKVGSVDQYGWALVDVHGPVLGGAECAAANRAAAG